MTEMVLKETDEYEKLVRFFVENKLEFDGDEEVDTDIVNCYEVTDKDGQLIGWLREKAASSLTE